MSPWLALPAFIALAVLPGAWVGALCAPREIGLLRFLAVGAMLSPFVLAVELPLVQQVVEGPRGAALLLLVVNLPALGLLARRAPRPRWPGRDAVLAHAAATAAPVLLLLLPALIEPGMPLFWAHGWLHADTARQLMAGSLLPECPDLAGVRLSYPAAGDVFHAVVGALADRPPLAVYGATNLVYLLLTLPLLSGLVRNLGGGARAQAFATLWLVLGLNVAGWIAGRDPLVGDWRYTPWLWNHNFLSQMPYGIGAIAALLFVLTLPEKGGLARRCALVAALLAAVAVIYPVLVPAALAAVMGAFLATLPRSSELRPERAGAARLGLVVAALLAVAISAVLYAVLTRDRAHGGMIVDRPAVMASKAGKAALALLPYVAGALIAGRRAARARPGAVIVLGVAALGSLALNIAIGLAGDLRGEYKFVFTASMAVFPFLGLAAEPLLERLGRAAPLVILINAALLAFPYWTKVEDFRSGFAAQDPPRLDLGSFELALDPGERLAGICRALRKETPEDALLLAEDERLHLPLLTGRSFYAPPRRKGAGREGAAPGMGLSSRNLCVLVFGYDEGLLEARRREVDAVFGDDAAARAQALAAMRALRRPLAVLVDEARRPGLGEVLEREAGARRLRTEGTITALLVP